MENDKVSVLRQGIGACEICADRFAATKTAHRPRPIVWFGPHPRILIAGQAPGMRVYETGKPFWDRSGDRLREWMGIDADRFYDRDTIAIVPMAFCFPGYSSAGSDLPPPPICAQTWHAKVMAQCGDAPLTLVIGGHAQRYHLRARAGVSATVAQWRDHAPRVFPLPHPSWRNTGWLKKNKWFETQLVPALQARVTEVLDD